MAKVTVLMNCLNGERFAKTAIDSVLKQTYKDFKVLFVDNCSTDRTAEIVKSFNDPRIKYVKTPWTVPLYEGRDYALDFIDTEYTCFLDIDDFWVHDKIAKQLDLAAETRATLLYTNFKNNLIDVKFIKYLRATAYYQLKFYRRKKVESGYRTLNDLLNNYDINLQTVMMKTAPLKELRFNKNLNWFGDADMFLRHAKQPGSKIYYSDKVTSYTSIHAKQLSRINTASHRQEVSTLMETSYPGIFSASEVNMFNRFIESK